MFFLKNKYFPLLFVSFLSYLIGGITIKYELFPYSLYKSHYRNSSHTPLVDYINKHKLITSPYNSSFQLLEELKKGGFIIYIRHADKFENESSHQIRSALDSFESVTANKYTHPHYEQGHALSEYGKVQSWILNKIFNDLEIPMNKVISSPIKRCRETAEIITELKVESSNLLLYDGILNSSEINKIKVKQLSLFQNSFSNDNNTLIVAHGFPVLQRIGINANIGQSDTLLLKKKSDGNIHVVGWFTINDWVGLLNRKSLHN